MSRVGPGSAGWNRALRCGAHPSAQTITMPSSGGVSKPFVLPGRHEREEGLGAARLHGGHAEVPELPEDRGELAGDLPLAHAGADARGEELGEGPAVSRPAAAQPLELPGGLHLARRCQRPVPRNEGGAGEMHAHDLAERPGEPAVLGGCRSAKGGARPGENAGSSRKERKGSTCPRGDSRRARSSPRRHRSTGSPSWGEPHDPAGDGAGEVVEVPRGEDEEPSGRRGDIRKGVPAAAVAPRDFREGDCWAGLALSVCQV